MISEKVHRCFWGKNYNCPMTAVTVLSEVFDITLDQQVLDAVIGMNGAGKFGAQCGLVEGCLALLGIIGTKNDMNKDQIMGASYDFASKFQERFGSLLCSVLRPEGFHPKNPPYLCENLAIRALTFNTEFISRKTGEAISMR